MPIDPSIPLNVKSYQPPDFMQQYGQVLSLRNLQERGKMSAIQLRQVEAQEKERLQDQKDDDVVRATQAELKGDYWKYPERLAGQISQKRYAAIVKMVDDTERERRADTKAAWDMKQQKNDRMGALAGTVTDKASLNAAADTAFKEGIIDEDAHARYYSSPFDDQMKAQMQSIQMRSASGRQIYEAGQKRFAEERSAEQAGIDTGLKLNAIGARQATPNDIAASTAERFRMDETGNVAPTGQRGVNLANISAPYQGQTYILPTPDEIAVKKVQDAKATATAQANVDLNKAGELQKITGVQVTPEMAATTGLPAGSYATPAQIANAGTAKQREQRLTGNGATGSLTVYQKATINDKKLTEADKLQEEEQALHRKRMRIGSLMQKNAEARAKADAAAKADPKAAATRAAAAATKGEAPVSVVGNDPEGKGINTYPANQETQQLLQEQLDETTKQVEDLQRRQKALLGQTSPGVPLGETGTTPPATVTPAPGRGGIPGTPVAQPVATPAGGKTTVSRAALTAHAKKNGANPADLIKAAQSRGMILVD